MDPSLATAVAVAVAVATAAPLGINFCGRDRAVLFDIAVDPPLAMAFESALAVETCKGCVCFPSPLIIFLILRGLA